MSVAGRAMDKQLQQLLFVINREGGCKKGKQNQIAGRV